MYCNSKVPCKDLRVRSGKVYCTSLKDNCVYKSKLDATIISEIKLLLIKRVIIGLVIVSISIISIIISIIYPNILISIIVNIISTIMNILFIIYISTKKH